MRVRLEALRRAVVGERLSLKMVTVALVSVLLTVSALGILGAQAAATKLGFVQQPGNSTGGVAFATQPWHV